MHPSNYRMRLSLDFLRIIVLPSVLFHLITTHLTNMHLGLLTALPSYLGFIICCSISKSFLTRMLQHARRQRSGAKEIPCVRGAWPGNVDILMKMLRAFKTSYILDVYLQLFEEYQCTTLNTRILWTDHIITMDQEHIKFVLSTGFEHFWRGRWQKERMERFLGQGIFNRDDEMWRMHRGNTRPFFARERISDFDIFEKYTARALNIISSTSNQYSGQTPIDVQDLYSRFALDAASEFLFGQNLDTLSATLPVAGKTKMGPKGSATEDPWGSFASAFEMAQQVITARSRVGYFWPVFEIFRDKNAPNAEVVHRWLDPLVKSALGEKERMEKAGICSPVAEKNFLQHLAESTDDSIIIRDQLLSLLLASRDTTACLLTYVTYFMAIYPEVANRLRTEVLEHCGATGSITYEQLRNLKYMRAVINETLRLYPPVPLNVRESRTGCTLPPSDSTYKSSYDADAADPRPLHMPGSTAITFLPLLTQRNKELWGSDADAFDPDRWLEKERLSRFVTNPTMFTPFSAGPRICLGQNYAYNEASFFLVRLLQQFDTFSLAPEAQPVGSLPPLEWKRRKGRQAEEQIWPAAALTLFVKGGLWVRVAREAH
ncbi:cytochrome P450 monooxygenase CYP63 [Lentinula guzmanii]|uniref:Cytochrome P450 monooxygenase CYP63 n=2 Tax=Lentinula TaxID=5352 RepID=A0AA38MWD9_9AGAR|nr:cytochrome P450 monooxygenase CYP63 [Lentinula guzmanii]KAJ3787082.1 cytochrome P450 monooxygenase CYP63 [Lentinula aff. detonsa]